MRSVRTKSAIVTMGVLIVGLIVYSFADCIVESPETRSPASIPADYESLSACEKQDVLWKNIQATVHKILPDNRPFGLPQILAMSRQEVGLKEHHRSDFAPPGWRKYLHGRGAIAKVKLVPRENPYTGIFQGADCALLRLSLTYRVDEGRAVAPGLALKVLRDGTHSANISALVSLDGQDKDFNFFRNPMSNIVPIGSGFGQKLVHRIFLKASSYPEELLAEDMAKVDARGATIDQPKAPRQIFFVPGEGLSFSSEAHEIRSDFATIPEGTTVYQIRLVPDKGEDFSYANYKIEDVPLLLQESLHVADIVTTSSFVASEFGDDGIFFRHQLRP